MTDFLNAIRKFIEEVAPALAMLLWDYEETKVDEQKNKALDAQVNLQLEKNHESVDQKYLDKSDGDIVHDIIANGEGTTIPGPGKSDSKPR